MKRVLIIPILAILAFSTSAFSQDYSESELQNIFMEMLSDEGMEGWIDSDGDVQFTYNDHSYFIEVNEDDNEFVRVVLFNIWPIESQSEAVQVAFAVDAVNREKKVAKAYSTNSDNVEIATELFINSPYDVHGVFMRCLRAIEGGLDQFISEM